MGHQLSVLVLCRHICLVDLEFLELNIFDGLLGLQSAEGREFFTFTPETVFQPAHQKLVATRYKCRTMINGGKKHGKRERLSNFPNLSAVQHGHARNVDRF